MGRLRVIGREAEAAMLAATGGINTHRGAIFGLGLLSAAAGARAGGRIARGMPLGAAVAALWGASILDDRIGSLSHGDAGPASLRRRRRAAGGCPRLSQRPWDRPACPAARHPARAGRSRGRPGRSMLCAHRLRRRHQSAAPGRPGRSSLRALRGARVPPRWRRGPAGLAEARAQASIRASSHGGSAPAARRIFSPCPCSSRPAKSSPSDVPSHPLCDHGDRAPCPFPLEPPPVTLAILCSGQGLQHPQHVRPHRRCPGSGGSVRPGHAPARRAGSSRYGPDRQRARPSIETAPARSSAPCRPRPPQRPCGTKCPAGSSSPAIASASWRPGALRVCSP